MAYWLDIWRFRNSIEYEYKWQGNYGAKGEKRQKKIKATPEQIKKQNQKNREKYVRRLLKCNFVEGDLWITLKYPAKTRKPLYEVKKDFKKFIDSLRGKYKRRGQPLKYIYRVEVGRKGGIHVHMVINRIRGEDTDLLIQKTWKHGRVNFTSIYESGGYESLAAYITKQPDEEVEKQLSMFPVEERKELISFNSSRNLIRPAPERKVYRKRTMRKLLEEGPKPAEGFYIDKNSIYSGINPYTGMHYLQYTEYRINEIAPVQQYDRKEGG